MSEAKGFTASQVIDTFGELIASLSAFAAKVPAQSMMAIPGGIRPTMEAVDAYESIVYRFRDGAGSTYRVLNGLFVNSLEAFEAGRVFDAVPPLLQAIEQLVVLHEEEKVKFAAEDQNRIRDFHQRLEKILPETSKPEVDLPTPESY
ncbi:MAG: hypothetical protein VST68_07785 [Nitrospirota bacterium]|nr:hypothetical protein [Nitrospirota bacterium]